jgi:spoIIIJ-associated protein
MEEVEKSAASVEEAIEAALEELGVSEQEAQIEIVQEPRQGFLGISAHSAIVRVRRAGATATATGTLSPDLEPEVIEEQGEMAANFLKGLLDAIGLDADVEVSVSDGVTYVDVWGVSAEEDMGLLIGRRGHNLEALQDLVRSYVQHQTEERCRVQVDVEDYRKRRRNMIAHKAQDAARRVRKTGRPESLEPMGAYERKIVHDTVADVGGLETASEGEEPRRYVVIRRPTST